MGQVALPGMQQHRRRKRLPAIRCQNCMRTILEQIKRKSELPAEGERLLERLENAQYHRVMRECRGYV